MNNMLGTLAVLTSLAASYPTIPVSVAVPTAGQMIIMPRKPVRSSNIVSIGYDEQSQTLEVEFYNRAVYQYYGVPASIYQGLMRASSHGEYLDANVKDVGYRYRRIQ